MLAMAPMPTDGLRIRVRVRAGVRPAAMAPPQCGQELGDGHSHGGTEREPHGHVHPPAEAVADAAAADAEVPPAGLQVVGDVPADGERRAGRRVQQRGYDGTEEQHDEHPPAFLALALLPPAEEQGYCL